MKSYLRLTIMFIVLAGIISVLPARAQYFFMVHPLVGEQAPDWTMSDINGKQIEFTKSVKGKDAVLFFWATWCPHCREQLEDLSRRQADLKKDGVELLLIDLGEDAETVRSFLDRRGMDFPVLLDLEGEVSDSYRVTGVPTFFLIDKEGIVKSVEFSLPEDYRSYFSAATKSE